MTPTKASSSWEGYGLLISTDQEKEKKPTPIMEGERPALANGEPNLLRDCIRISGPTNTNTAIRSAQAQRSKLIPPLLALSSRTAVPPTCPTLPEAILVLSADHCLLTLVHYNVLRAVLSNLSILSLLSNFPPTCGPLLNIPSFGVVPPHLIPPDLQPTPLQNQTPHPFWIDAIPFPGMRDNLILHLGQYDIDDLRFDFGEGLYVGFDDVERRCCLVWGQPWSIRGWEVSEGFIKKWRFLLQDCSTIIDSTNYWRGIRGEDYILAV